MRTHGLSSLVMLLLILSTAQAFPQSRAIETDRATWGADKVPNGSMNEWSSLGGLGGHGTVDNEWYFYDSGEDFWNDPQGGDGDEPLSILVMVDHPVTGNPEPVASGFNLWGGYLCYEPYHDDYSMSVAVQGSNVDSSMLSSFAGPT